MTSKTPPYVVAVVVTYHPDLDLLGAQLACLVPQVTGVVLVDNGSPCDLVAWNAQLAPAVAAIIALGENRGIATAQNVGIQWARNRGAEFILLMDQDSLPASDMVEKLMHAILKQESPAAVGPRYLDERQNNPPPFIRVQGLRLKRCCCITQSFIVPVDYLISSGCLIPVSVLKHIGGMREELFIDYVDIEWGLRARSFGYRSYGVCSAHMKHSLGDKPIKIFGRDIPMHCASRHYYHFRNAMLLYKVNWIPLNWKLVDGWRLILKYGFYSIFAKSPVEHWRMMTLGIRHGLQGKVGRLQSD